MEPDSIIIREATAEDSQYAVTITDEMLSSAIKRGTGISKRSPESIVQKMKEGKAIIAITASGQWVGFSYLEVWNNGKFVSNSGLIVHPGYRQQGIASRIKQKIFNLSRTLYPAASIFSITTSMAIMKLNTALGFEPVVFDALEQGEIFWQGCTSCVNYSILQSKQCKHCLCTAMLYEPGKQTDLVHERET